MNRLLSSSVCFYLIFSRNSSEKGFDIQSDDAKAILENGSFINKMQPFWFGGHPDYDDLCQIFTPVVRDAGRGALQTENDCDWESVDGKLSQLILCDQLSRNCFRGTDEAFQYDGTSIEISRDLAGRALSDDPEFYGSYTMFLSLALMHSEELRDHKLGFECLDKAIVTCPEAAGVWDGTRSAFLQHTEVIEQFGRYPHRNTKKGRTTTKEEQEWLNSPDIPFWAKSQD